MKLSLTVRLEGHRFGATIVSRSVEISDDEIRDIRARRWDAVYRAINRLMWRFQDRMVEKIQEAAWKEDVNGTRTRKHPQGGYVPVAKAAKDSLR